MIENWLNQNAPITSSRVHSSQFYLSNITQGYCVPTQLSVECALHLVRHIIAYSYSRVDAQTIGNPLSPKLKASADSSDLVLSKPVSQNFIELIKKPLYDFIKEALMFWPVSSSRAPCTATSPLHLVSYRKDTI